MVDKSSVEAVDKANAERRQALHDCEKRIKEIQYESINKTYEAHENQRQAEAIAKEATQTLKSRSFLYFGLLAFTLLCCGVMNNQVRSDFGGLFTGMCSHITLFLSAYGSWFMTLSDTLEVYWAWIIRILTILLILAFVCGVGALFMLLFKKYRKRWCTLSLKVLAVSIAALTIFAEPIRSIVPINLIYLFFLIQAGYLIVLWYFDGYYANRYRSDEWARIQNS